MTFDHAWILLALLLEQGAPDLQRYGDGEIFQRVFGRRLLIG